LFDGGQRQSLTDAAIANYDANVATYKQTILNAFQEVEDNLVALRLLEEQAEDQDLAVKSAREALEKTLNLYKAGNVDYNNLITVQINTLNNETAALNILSRKLITSVELIKALGGAF
jgi:outer membrane protein TolC